MAARQRTSHRGPARQAHDERAAARLLRLGLEALELHSADLTCLPKGALEKALLAAWLRQLTTASLGWIAERLDMGHESRVSQALGRMRHRPGRKLKQLQRKLAAAAGEMEKEE